MDSFEAESHRVTVIDSFESLSYRVMESLSHGVVESLSR